MAGTCVVRIGIWNAWYSPASQCVCALDVFGEICAMLAVLWRAHAEIYFKSLSLFNFQSKLNDSAKYTIKRHQIEREYETRERKKQSYVTIQHRLTKLCDSRKIQTTLYYNNALCMCCSTPFQQTFSQQRPCLLVRQSGLPRKHLHFGLESCIAIVLTSNQF